ncbi:MAG: hypothetical protein HY393_00490 [Candidatus Diapherotrites archaeon]|nr:hypothetical protein [Candidatus Diapherotrites archaeon]
MKRTGPTKKATRVLHASLKRASAKSKSHALRVVADELFSPTRKRVTVGVWKLARMGAKHKGKWLVVPGKVVGNEAVSEKLWVAALAFSASARKRIAREGKAITLEEFARSGAKPSDMVIVK